ncbi:MAG TPA: helix-turn-helix transcriptional regulator [Chloroflexota bacterium]
MALCSCGQGCVRAYGRGRRTELAQSSHTSLLGPVSLRRSGLQAQSFGEQLGRYRRRVGLSQVALATRVGLGVSAVSALERGVRRRPYPHTVHALATALALVGDEREAFINAARPVRHHEPGGAANGSEQAARATVGLPVVLSSFVGRQARLSRQGSAWRGRGSSPSRGRPVPARRAWRSRSRKPLRLKTLMRMASNSCHCRRWWTRTWSSQPLPAGYRWPKVRDGPRWRT